MALGCMKMPYCSESILQPIYNLKWDWQIISLRRTLGNIDTSWFYLIVQRMMLLLASAAAAADDDDDYCLLNIAIDCKMEQLLTCLFQKHSNIVKESVKGSVFMKLYSIRLSQPFYLKNVYWHLWVAFFSKERHSTCWWSKHTLKRVSM